MLTQIPESLVDKWKTRREKKKAREGITTLLILNVHQYQIIKSDVIKSGKLLNTS